jgi:hypothetical protein
VSKRKRADATVMTTMLKAFSEICAQKSITPFNVEERALGWKHTDRLLRQATNTMKGAVGVVSIWLLSRSLSRP